MSAPAPEPSQSGWRRLHPLSPIVRAGPGLVALVVVFVPTLVERHRGRNDRDYYDLAVVAFVLVVGTVSWLVTRWRVEGGVLRIDSGLLRRTSKRFPLSQVQAIDTVRPLLARLFGLSELRLRMAGSEAASGRLAYLTAAHAEVLRARLLALAHGVAEATPAPPERQLVTLPTWRLLASLALSGPGLVTVVIVAALAAVDVVDSAAAVAAIIGGGATVFLGLATASWRRFNGDYRLTVAEAADGLRLRSGLLQTEAETIPRGRVQAARLVEPLLWRPLAWCRLEVDVAGKQRRKRKDRSQGRQLRALLPVGGRDEATWLLSRVFPNVPLERRRAPARVRWKSPLRFRHLSWGSNDVYVVATSGRLRRVTDWVPLSKVQSIRQVDGPVQRRLRLATIHLDTAGRNVHAVLRDRDQAEAAHLMDVLPRRCADARRREAPWPLAGPGVGSGPGRPAGESGPGAETSVP
jgi:putative membrane protein